MNTLMITRRYGAKGGPAARRLDHLAGAFAAKGAVVVVCVARTPDVATSPARLFPVEDGGVRRLGPAQGSTIDARYKSNRLVRSLLSLRKSYPFVLWLGDGNGRYRQRAFTRAVELVEREEIQQVFSSFAPYSDHLVARRLKTRYPHLHWIADFRDLPVDPVRKDVWFPALQRWWGKRVIRSANELWVVSEGQRAQLCDWHPTVRVVRNAMTHLPPARSAPWSGRFTIAYTGSFYPWLLTVAPLVNGLKQLLAEGSLLPEELLLQYRGKDLAAFRERVRGLPAASLDLQPAVDPAAARALQENAQVLLLLTWSAPDYYGLLTAKLWDYLATGRPVVAIVRGPGDRELKDILEGASAGAVFGTKEQGKVTKHLRALVATWREEGTIATAPDLARLRQYC